MFKFSGKKKQKTLGLKSLFFQISTIIIVVSIVTIVNYGIGMNKFVDSYKDLAKTIHSDYSDNQKIDVKFIFHHQSYIYHSQSNIFMKINEDYKILSQEVRAHGENIPPLINAYMNLSPTMKTFGTVINKSFGNVEETGMMITLKDMYVSKINRHLASYREDYELPI